MKKFSSLLLGAIFITMLLTSCSKPSESVPEIAVSEEVQRMLDYWLVSEEFCFTMPYNNSYDDEWKVGIGIQDEWSLGIPFKYYGVNSKLAQDMAAYSFNTINYIYYDGFNAVEFSDCYLDEPNGLSIKPIQYISTTQPDCKTNRGISVGSSIADLQKSYPEIDQMNGYWTEFDEASGIVEHDNCWMYFQQGTHRSILFLSRDDIIVQIDMADGLDGQYSFPRGTGVYDEFEY